MTRHEITIDLGERGYPIRIGTGLLDDPELLRREVAGEQVLVVTNEVVAPLYLEPVRRAFSDRRCEVAVLPDGEAHKSVDQWQRLVDRLVAMEASRDVTLVALGGGVIGDLTGFAAATWMRGVPFIQVPTTLLAQVDASVGGKTAVNLPAGKNLIGAFHQPRSVIVDIDTLATLPGRELRGGLAEVIKCALIRDRAFLDQLADRRRDLLSLDPEAVGWAIERACRHKAEVVAEDEREAGARALLNLGHTFGHAIEAVAGYGAILHGEAVAIGCCAAARLSALQGRITEADAGRVEALLASFELPVRIPAELDTGELMATMRLDKKSVSGRLRLVLLAALGRAVLVEGTEDAAVRRVLDTLR